MTQSKEYIPYYKKITQAINKADYTKALELAEQAFELFPQNRMAELDYFMIMADLGRITNGVKGRRLYREGLKGLRSLMHKLRSFSKNDRIKVKNEFYFQARKHKKQYELGIQEFNKQKDPRYCYISGVGAAWYANEMFERGQIARCRSWAQRAIDSWQKYLAYRKDYYNSYVHYALALGFLGKEEEMNLALKKAQIISKKNKSFSEFKEVRKIIEKFKRTQQNNKKLISIKTRR